MLRLCARATYALLVLLACNAKQATAAPPLLLPNATTECSLRVIKEWSWRYPSCARALVNFKDPDDECCTGVVRYFGVDGTEPSRNCFCVPEVFAKIAPNPDLKYGSDIPEFFTKCSCKDIMNSFQQMMLQAQGKKGYLVPLYAEGEGPCAGGAWNLTDESAAESEPEGAKEMPLAAKSLHQWLRDLKKDGLVLVSFISGVISVFGFGGALWMFAVNIIRSFMHSKYE